MLKRQREGQRRTVDMVKKRNKMPGEEDSRKKKRAERQKQSHQRGVGKIACRRREKAHKKGEAKGMLVACRQLIECH